MTFYHRLADVINKEYVDEQNKINRQVVDDTYKQVSVFDDVRKPLGERQESSIFVFEKDIEILSKALLGYIDAYNDVLSLDLEGLDFSLGNLIIPYNNAIRQIISEQATQSTKNVLKSDMARLLPALTSAKIATKKAFDELLDRLAKIDTSKSEFKAIFGFLPFVLTEMAVINLMENNIQSNKFTQLTYDDISVEFNKLISEYTNYLKGYKKQMLALSLSKSPITMTEEDRSFELQNFINRYKENYGREPTKEEITEWATVSRLDMKHKPLIDKQVRFFVDPENWDEANKQYQKRIGVPVGPTLKEEDPRLYDEEKEEDQRIDDDEEADFDEDEGGDDDEGGEDDDGDDDDDDDEGEDIDRPQPQPKPQPKKTGRPKGQEKTQEEIKEARREYNRRYREKKKLEEEARLKRMIEEATSKKPEKPEKQARKGKIKT